MAESRYGEGTGPDIPLETVMTEDLWIELIRVMPTFIWLGFAIIALMVIRQVLTSEAHRMTKVETPFVSVELAREAIEQANHRGMEHPDTNLTTPSLPSPLPQTRPPIGDYPLNEKPRADRAEGDSLADTNGGSHHGRLHIGEQRSPQESLPESDIDEHDDPRLDRGLTAPEPDAPPREETPPRPSRPLIPSQPHPVPSAPYLTTTEPVPDSPQNLPSAPYRPRPSLSAAVESQRGLRAATRLALSTDLLQGGAILWVDDHHEWNEPLVRLFRTAGIKVDTAESTDEALRAMMVESYDLVITDTRRDNEPSGASAGMALLDRMVGSGVPTPAIFFSSHPKTEAAVHPRAVTATSSPEELVNHVIDRVGHRHHRQGERKSLRLPWRQR